MDVNLAIEKGEIFGFIGPNGAGKSTTIRILLNLVYAQRGNGRIFGLDIVKDAKKIKKLIGYMPSEIDYYHTMSVLEFLRYSASFYEQDCEERIQQLADLFQLDLRRKILDLSLGNKKKVGILQSLIHRPKLLILDEPTSGLDPLMQAKFFELLQEENHKGATIFFSSHILSEVQKLCQRVAIIREGKVIQIEDIATLRHKQLKKVTVETNNDFISALGELEGVSEIKTADSKISFIFTGDFNHLITVLEEIFMHYYTS
jgi:ABC-2 type transport system ATP-binding protein